MSISYLVPGTGTDGTQLWVLTVNDDGTSSATERVDFYPGSTLSAFSPLASGGTVVNPYFTEFGGGFLFVGTGLADESDPTSPNYGKIAADGSPSGRELWFTDGTAAGTHLVYDIFTGTYDAYNPSSSQNVAVGNSSFDGPNLKILSIDASSALFVARKDSSSSNTYLFGTDGTASATQQITFNNLYNPTNLTLVNGQALFTAVVKTGSSYASYAFVTDGTSDGTQKISTESGVNRFAVTESASGGQEAFFTGSDAQLWVTDGSSATKLTTGAQVVPDAAVLDLGGGSHLFFSQPNQALVQLWVTDGTSAGTSQLRGDLGSNLTGVAGTLLLPSGNSEAFFQVTLANGATSLFVSDGTSGGTQAVASWAGAVNFAAATSGSHLFFGTADGSGNVGLSVTDGTISGTRQIAAAGVTSVSSGPNGGAVFTEIVNGSTILYITNGTVSGTHALTSPGLVNFSETVVGNTVFFTADDGVYPAPVTTKLFAAGLSGSAVQLNVGNDTGFSDFSVLGDRLFFNARNAGGVTESWISDGTQAGTHIVQGGVVTVGAGATPFNAPLPCFLAGTRLRTPDGDTAVESLREGDLVLTGSGQTAPIIWIGQREVDLARHPASSRVAPVRIRRGAFGDNLPSRDLLLSPDHAVAVDGALIPVQHLIGGDGIAQETPDRAHYFHIELPVHDIVLAEGLAVESYLDTGNRANFSDAEGPITLHPDFWALHWDGACAPLVVAGPLVEAARARLHARAEMELRAAA